MTAMRADTGLRRPFHPTNTRPEMSDVPPPKPKPKPGPGPDHGDHKPPTKTEARRQAISDLLLVREPTPDDIADLARWWDVSEKTIRKDIKRGS